MKKVRLAVIGSRNIKGRKQKEYIRKIMTKIIKENKVTHFISGGAIGVDSIAESIAKEIGLKIKVYYPEWNKYGNSAGNLRNSLIIKKANIVLAFWDNKSTGTKDSIQKALFNLKTKKLFIYKRKI